MESFSATSEQKANLAKLADYLDTLPRDYARFDMHTFMGIKSDDGRYLSDISVTEAGPLTKCGSCACAIGHGPLAGIPIDKQDTHWSGYSWRVFGANSDSEGAGEYMFGLDNPNDHYAAADRIRKVLNGEMP